MHVGATALWVALLAAFDARAVADGADDSSSALIAKHYIVEYESGTSRIASADGEIVVLKSFESNVFSGAHVQTDAYDLDTLARARGIKNAWPNEQIPLAPTEPLAQPGDFAVSSEYDPHNATGVGKLHALGIYGEGVVIGVVDTGTAYNHPALGGGFGPGFKVEGGYDFVGDQYWPSAGTKEPDEDPDDLQGHGTHVSGIIAGESDFGWVGVAPKATLRSYKVFSNAGSTDTATLIEAFLKAYSDGVDIITASIGGTGGWAENAWGEVASRLVDQGVVVTISAGNSGSDGPFFGTNGAYGTNVVAVASIASEKLPATPFAVTFHEADGSNRTDLEGYLPASGYYPPEIAGWEVRPMSFDTSEPADGCEPYPADTPRLEGVIPLVRRGTCAFAVKQTHLAALGAEYMLFYNNESPMITPSSVDSSTQIALVTGELGAAIIATVQAGGSVTADFSVNPERPLGVDYAAGGLASTFTSWGGTYDLAIKPDVAGPGGNIFSTYLDGGYAVLSGTSMACPYVAGVAALYIGAHGGRDRHGPGFARDLARRLVASGRSVPWYPGGSGRPDFDLPAPVAQVGTGLVDAFKVVRYTTAIRFDKMALNDTHHFNRHHSVRLTHDAAAAGPVTFNFTLEPAAGFEVGGWFPLGTTIGEYRLRKFEELTPKSLVVPAFLPQPVTLRPGETKDVTIAFDPPDRLGWNSSALPLYSGKVLISGSNGEQFSVPYMGIASNLEKEVKPIFRSTYPFSKSTVQFIDIKEKPYYTFNLSTTSQDFPKIFTKLVWGTREIRWDIFEKDWHEHSWTYPPVPGQAGYVGTVASWVGAGQVSSFDPARYDADETFSFPVRDVTRNAFSALSFGEFWWFGKLGNGSQIANGNYTMRFAALRPFGNPAAADNWDVFQVPKVQVLGHY